VNAKSFNVGSYRRADTPRPTAEFFDTSNPEGERLRRAAAEAAVTDMLRWFEHEGGHVGILDATNSTKTRREWIKERCEAKGYDVLFVESKCDDEDLIMSNILEVKTTSPDYVGQDPELAARDFRERIRNYEKVYETVDEPDSTYVKLINVGSQVIINQVSNYLQTRIIYFTMNLHITPRSIWLSRVSIYYYSSSILNANLFCSMANPNSMCRGKSVVMLVFLPADWRMPMRSQNWSSILSEIRM
jgi:6-phosphofructo-2-kinase/fructose-2,6-biphosphatase 2